MKKLQSIVAAPLVAGAFVAAVIGMSAPVAFAHEPETESTDETASEAEAEQDHVTLIQAGWLLAIPGEEPLRNRTIVVRNSKIERIEHGYLDRGQVGESEAHLIDLRDKYVLPGLMDMHVHLSFEFGKDSFAISGVNAGLDPHGDAQREDLASLVEAMANAEKTLAAGYTTVRNVGSSGWNILALKQAIEQGRVDGPRILTAMDTIRPSAANEPGACSGAEDCRKVARRQIDHGADVIKIYASCSGSKPCGREDAPGTFLPDEIDGIVAVARSREIPVAAHSHSADGVVMSLRAGVDSIEHGSYTPPEAHDLFKRNGAFLVPTMSVVQHNVKNDVQTAEEPMKSVMENFINNHARNVMAAYDAGVLIAAGSDAGVTPHGKNARELEFYVEQGMPAADAIKAATIHAASLIRRTDELGTIEVGKIADIIAVGADPLANILALQDVNFVMKDGAVFHSQDALNAQ